MRHSQSNMRDHKKITTTHATANVIIYIFRKTQGTTRDQCCSDHSNIHPFGGETSVTCRPSFEVIITCPGALYGEGYHSEHGQL